MDRYPGQRSCRLEGDSQVVDDLVYDLIVGDKGDDLHRYPTLDRILLSVPTCGYQSDRAVFKSYPGRVL